MVEIIRYHMRHLSFNNNGNEFRAVNSYTVRDVRLRRIERQDPYASSLLEECQHLRDLMQHLVPRLLVLWNTTSRTYSPKFAAIKVG